jgi:hypothetical protein
VSALACVSRTITHVKEIGAHHFARRLYDCTANAHLLTYKRFAVLVDRVA